MESIADFIQGRSSYAVIKERKGVSIGTLSKWVNIYGSSCLTPVEISKRFNLNTANKWSRILLLDAKYLNKGCNLLLAVDYLTLDIVAHLVSDSETEESYAKLIDTLEASGYKIRAVISDGHSAILSLLKAKRPKFMFKGSKRYPRPGIPPAVKPKPRLENIPHAWCVVHAQRDLNTNIAKLKLTKEVSLKLKKAVDLVLFAKTFSQAKRALNDLVNATRSNPKIFNHITLWIWERWDLLTLHFHLRVNGRKIPRSTNSIENVISYVNTRLKTMRRVRSLSSGRAITNLIVANYRTKPLINTKNKLKRGRSPLSLAIGKNMKINWVTFIKKSTA